MEECNNIFVKFAEKLVGNYVDENVVRDVLKLICKSASFEYGAIYEIELNKFCLREYYLKDDFSYSPMLDLNTQMIEDTAHYVTRSMAKDSRDFATQLLYQLNASTLFMIPIIDEKQSVQGFITLFNKVEEIILEQDSIDYLSSLLYMLVHYVDRRTYIKKTDSSMSALDAVLNNTGIDVYVNDYDTHDILYVNQSMAAPYGGVEKLMGRKCWEALFPGQSGPCEFCPKYHIVDENKEPSNVYSWDYQRAFDGSWFRVFSAAFYWENGRLAHVVSSADITDNKLNEAKIENLANYDQLTQLPNRRMLVKECEKRIDKATLTEKGYVLFFDIDGFKGINDDYGHDAGDEFLIKLGEFFSSIPILKNSIFRNGGDEFVAVFGGENYTERNVEDLSSFILNRFKQPWIIKGKEIYCNTSIGVACYPEDGNVAENLIQIADQAMYQVKKSGGAGMCFGYQLKNRNKI